MIQAPILRKAVEAAYSGLNIAEQDDLPYACMPEATAL